ncbi:MAG: hypothetical protein ACI9R3_001135 [Verrucomicrobiales bacterium]|jgi:hypothetical protein
MVLVPQPRKQSINDGTSFEEYRAGVIIAELKAKNLALTEIVNLERSKPQRAALLYSPNGNADPLLDEYNPPFKILDAAA